SSAGPPAESDSDTEPERVGAPTLSRVVTLRSAPSLPLSVFKTWAPEATEVAPDSRAVRLVLLEGAKPANGGTRLPPPGPSGGGGDESTGSPWLIKMTEL